MTLMGIWLRATCWTCEMGRCTILILSQYSCSFNLAKEFSSVMDYVFPMPEETENPGFEFGPVKTSRLSIGKSQL